MLWRGIKFEGGVPCGQREKEAGGMVGVGAELRRCDRNLFAGNSFGVVVDCAGKCS